MKPLLSVLMPAYNCENYISDAMSGILQQNFQDLEFIIINDGSTDKTRDKVLSFRDLRIRFYENSINLGLVETLNRGLALASGKYILRTDADDIALPNMINDLVSFMERHNDYIVCGGFMRTLKSGKIISYPVKDRDLKIYTLNACPFSHSTVIFRRKILDDNSLKYSRYFLDGEDHALWSELLLYGKFFNIKKITLLYRESCNQVTAGVKYLENYNLARERIFRMHARKYFDLNDESADAYVKLVLCQNVSSLSELEKIGSLILQIRYHNKINGPFDNSRLSKFLFIKWHWLCYHSYSFGQQVYKIYLKYMLAGGNIFRIKSIIAHSVKLINFKFNV